MVFLPINVCGNSWRLTGSLLSDDSTDPQLLTADPYTDFQQTNDMRAAAQRMLFKQNSARAVQAEGLARHRSQPREGINAGDTALVWRNNKLTGRKGWTGPGVVVAVSPTRPRVESELNVRMGKNDICPRTMREKRCKGLMKAPLREFNPPCQKPMLHKPRRTLKHPPAFT